MENNIKYIVKDLGHIKFVSGFQLKNMNSDDYEILLQLDEAHLNEISNIKDEVIKKESLTNKDCYLIESLSDLQQKLNMLRKFGYLCNIDDPSVEAVVDADILGQDICDLKFMLDYSNKDYYDLLYLYVYPKEKSYYINTKRIQPYMDFFKKYL